MKTKPEEKPARVGAAGAKSFAPFPKQVGEARDRWDWVEPAVWTKRMLARLAQSGEKTVWFSLWDKVWMKENQIGRAHV